MGGAAVIHNFSHPSYEHIFGGKSFSRDFDLKLQMKTERAGRSGISYRSATGVPWTLPQPSGQPPYDLKLMMT